MTNWTQILAIISFFLALVDTLGIVLALSSSKLEEEQKIAERVRDMYHDENELLLSRVTRLEADSKHCNKVIELIIDTLQKVKGITLEVEDSVITLRDGASTHRSKLSDTGPLKAV